MTELEDQLIDLEKSLAGFHPTHPVRAKLISQIAILRPKVASERAGLADPRTLEQKRHELEQTLAGYHAGHYIRGSLESQIATLTQQIKKNEMLN
jgi:hypothetical protein